MSGGGFSEDPTTLQTRLIDEQYHHRLNPSTTSSIKMNDVSMGGKSDSLGLHHSLEVPSPGGFNNLKVDDDDNCMGSDLFGQTRMPAESMSSQEGRGRLIEKTCQNAMLSTENPVKLSWHNLQYTVQVPTTKQERKEGAGNTKAYDVLKGITGYALPGQTLYVMGPSGAGKTSFMNALSARINLKRGNYLKGQILLNDSA